MHTDIPWVHEWKGILQHNGNSVESDYTPIELPFYQMQGTIIQNNIWVHQFISIILTNKNKEAI